MTAPRKLKRSHDARRPYRVAGALLAKVFAMYPDMPEDDDWTDDYDGGPTCGHCGAGLLALEDGECWHCGHEL